MLRSLRAGPDGYILLAVAILTVGLYLPAIFTGLVSDDYSILALSDARTFNDFVELWDPHPGWFYRPIQKVVFFASLRVFGTAGIPLHLFFVAIHLLNAVLIWRVCKSFGATWAGVAAASYFLLIWRIHEAVAWAAAGSELLAGCFSLLCILTFRKRQEGSPLWLVPSVLCYGLAVLSKESAAALPVAIALLCLLDDKRHIVERFADLIPFAAIGAGFVYLQIETGTRTEEELITRGGLAFGFAEQQLWIITDLIQAALPEPWGSEVALQPMLQPRWGIVALVVVALLARLANGRLAAFGAVLAIALSLVYVPFIEAVEDRYVYLPAIGTVIMLVGLLDIVLILTARIHKAVPPVIAITAVVVALAPGMPRLTERIDAWRSAGEAADRALATVQRLHPRPAAGTVFAFRNVPDTIRGAFVFRNGLAEAVRFQYEDRTLQAFRLVTGNPPAGAIVVDVP